MQLIKPPKLNKNDTVATISPCWGIAGNEDCLWRYNLGKERLEEMGLNVVAAPNSMRGEEYLKKNPLARAEDILWCFENKDVNAIIANIGGNDSNLVVPFLNSNTLIENPKIFIGYSDVMNIHLYCYKAGLSTFYGHNLLTDIAEIPRFHPYSKYWFEKVLFNNDNIGELNPADEYSCDPNDYFNKGYVKKYHSETGYLFIQGEGRMKGELFGGHLGIRDFGGISAGDFDGKIVFLEDIANFFSPKQLSDFLDWLAETGALQRIKGLLIGKLCDYRLFDEHKQVLIQTLNRKYGLADLPVVANMNFGHTSPSCILPYGATAEINCENKTVSILEPGVI